MRAVIVGAGPAGFAAASVLARTPVEVTLVDEGQRPGGQVYRAPAPGLGIDMRRLLGRDFTAYRDFHAAADALRDRIDYRPLTLAWSIHGGAVHVASRGGLQALSYDVLILATGAADRVMPVSGWTLPGVFTLGAAQVLLKEQGCLIGRRVAFCGSSPLLYLAALQYRRMGGAVAAVIDTTRFSEKVRAIPQMLAAPAVLADGLRTMAALRRQGVPVVHGATIERFEGGDRLSAVVYRRAGGAPERVACDAAAYGHGLQPETQLAELAGAEMSYDPGLRLHVPASDEDGRIGNGIYVAGDGGIIGGAIAAAASGTLAGAAAIRHLGVRDARVDLAGVGRTIDRQRRFQRGLRMAFAWPAPQIGALDDAVTLCRCENVSIGEVRDVIRQPLGPAEANRVKAATRCGMGRCQGRFCGPALSEVTAAMLGRADAPLDRLRVQAPIKPLPIALAHAAPHDDD
jgi:NADPH-dependent 2,4-dienoyl-CoA reductase/sulfur reductase-like enzyme